MNLKLVLRTYSALRQLTDDESALLTTLRSLNDTERDLLVESLAPVRAGKSSAKSPTTRKIEHCEACDYTKRHFIHKDSSRTGYHEFQSAQPKSKRAKGMAAAIKDSLQRGKQAKVDGDDDDAADTDNDDNNTTCATCGLAPDANVHHLETVAGWHEFDSGEKSVGASGD